MTALRPDVADAVARYAARAYATHAPAHLAIDLLNGTVAHLERSCRQTGLDPTKTRKLLDAFLQNVLTDVAAGAAADMADEQRAVKAMRANPKQNLPPVGRSRYPEGYVREDYFRRVYDEDYPRGDEIE